MTMESKGLRERRIETADHLGRLSADRVACPACGSTSLSMRDVEYGLGHECGIQRCISCARCGAFSGVNVKRAGKPASMAASAADY